MNGLSTDWNALLEAAHKRAATREAVVATILTLPTEDHDKFVVDVWLEVKRRSPCAKALAAKVLADIPSTPPTAATTPGGLDKAALDALPPYSEIMKPGEPAKPRTFMDQAEVTVLASPRGITTAALAKYTGQQPRAAYATLRSLALKRRTIVHRNGKWFAVDGRKGKVKARVKTEQAQRATKARAIRDVILEVFNKNTTEPLGYNRIIDLARAVEPSFRPKSVGSAIYSLRDNGLLISPAYGTYTKAPEARG